MNVNSIKFDEKTHEYFYNNKKLNYTVTGVVSIAYPFNRNEIALKMALNIKNNKNPTYIKIFNNVKKDGNQIQNTKNAILKYWDELTKIGNDVHLISERYIKQGIKYNGNKLVQQWNSIKIFFYQQKCSGYAPLFAEYRIVNPNFNLRNEIGIGGTVDIILENKVSNEHLIVDIKVTSKRTYLKELKWKLQLGFYYKILLDCYKERFNCIGLIILRIDPFNGNSEIIRYNLNECFKEVENFIMKENETKHF